MHAPIPTPRQQQMAIGITVQMMVRQHKPTTTPTMMATRAAITAFTVNEAILRCPL